MTNKEEISRIIHFLKDNEPSLSEEEKREMWSNIEQKHNQLEKKDKIRVCWRKTRLAAAVIALLIACAVIFSLYTKIDDANTIDVTQIAKVSASTLFIEGKTMEMGNNAEIYCLPKKMKLRIKQGGGFVNVSYTSDKDLALAVPDKGNIKVHLADGSVVLLRGRSNLKFPFLAERRKVYVDGEAYFNVMHRHDIPFITQAGELTIRVLGTEYMVNAKPTENRQSVSLISGVVEVLPKGGKSVTRIKPGECFVYDISDALSRVKPADLESVNAWKEDLIVLREKCITDLLMQVEQLYNVNLSYSITDLQSIRISGKLDTSVPVGTFLNNLSQIAPIKVDKKAEEYIITYNKP